MSWLARLLGASGTPGDSGTPGGMAATERSTDAAPEQGLASGTVLVDVRSSGEFNGGHIEGALSIPLDRIQTEITRIVPDRKAPLVLYCQSGGRSGSACRIVAAMGYESVRNGGGIRALSRAIGRPVTR